LMRRRNWHIRTFHELPHDSEDRGQLAWKYPSKGTGNAKPTYELSLKLRFGEHGDRIIGMKDILMSIPGSRGAPQGETILHFRAPEFLLGKFLML
jgi:hypothetical protein